ncbi:hypothetical protein E2P81_ATG08328 [Venturia nashicola]|uniref:Uncharacterized protein n=1 Tax=Venturia nashicola TaxID=86259 RepID=A0A4Z1NI83_9PEZI|nr:hypothetical protein E6O75_ATG08516 [Venturia nashicola]TLD21740.1 hypothetical protein E2P81_ATG08328 [Venturia nashicola]
MALILLDIARNFLYILPILAYLFPAYRRYAAALCFWIAADHILPGNIAMVAAAIFALFCISVDLAEDFQGNGEAMDTNIFPL